MMKTLRRGRKDKAKGISLYTNTILDDVERENAQAAAAQNNTPPDTPISPTSPTSGPSQSPKLPPQPPPKRPLPQSRLGHSAEIPRSSLALSNEPQELPRDPRKGTLRPQAPNEPSTFRMSGLAPESKGTTGADTTISEAEEVVPEDKDAFFREKEEAVMKFKENMKKVTHVGKKYNSEANKHVKGMNAVTECMEKLSANDKKLAPDSVYVEALSKFVQIDKAIAEGIAKAHQNMNDNLLNQINNFVEEDIQHELKNLKAKYEKARRDYDSACSKVTNLRSKKNLDILKLYAAEKEAIKAKAKYHASLDAALIKIEEIELKKQTDLMEWLMKYVTVQKESFGEGYAMLNHIQGYLQELSNWTKEWRNAFQENSYERNQEQQHKLAEEDQSLHVPLIELVKNEELVAVMKQVATQEGVILPPLDINIQTHWSAVHAFLRDNYDPISQVLLMNNKKQLLLDLSSALGLLEKANEVIDLSS